MIPILLVAQFVVADSYTGPVPNLSSDILFQQGQPSIPGTFHSYLALRRVLLLLVLRFRAGFRTPPVCFPGDKMILRMIRIMLDADGPTHSDIPTNRFKTAIQGNQSNEGLQPVRDISSIE